MPWEGPTVMEKKLAFVREYRRRVLSREQTMVGLCEEHQIAPKTGYKWIGRCDELGLKEGLKDRSRRPGSGEHWKEEELVIDVIRTRQQFPQWGARTIIAYLEEHEPERPWPAPSVAHEWLRKARLVEPKRRGKRYPHPGKPPAIDIVRPNQIWSVDFKGHFRTQDRRYCYPLTIADSFSRYLLGCESLPTTSLDLVWPVFVRLFREYGLPEIILSDNGAPFSSNSVRRLSQLSVRWIRLGIRPLLIEPGKPQQNGRHERMHRTLKATACTPMANWREQQQTFDAFIEHLNHVRPHQALGKKTPAQLYSKSPRPFPKRLPEVTYAPGIEVRRVRTNGEIKWKGQHLFLSESLIGEPIGFDLVDDGCWVLRFAHLELGYYSERDKKLHLDTTRPDGKAENK